MASVTMREAGEHAHRILEAVRQGAARASADEAVARSWTRCLNEHRLHPDRPHRPPVLAPAELAARQARLADVIDCARHEMATLHQQLGDAECAVVLTDTDGVILHMVSSSAFAADVTALGFHVGAVWSEAEAGTNGMGTALVDERPVLVHADEHFMHANHFLTCQASPILDPRGNILGVLDVSGDRRGYHPHTMGLVKMSARMIENHWLSDDFRDALRLHFHMRPEFIGTLMEGILAIDRDGRCLGANRSALDLLGLSGAAVRMHTVSSLLGSPVGAIVDACRLPQATPLRLALPNGQLVYAQARCNWTLWQPAGAGSAEAADVAAEPTPQAAAGPDTTTAPAATPSYSFARLLTGDGQVEAAIGKIRRVLDRQRGQGRLLRPVHARADLLHAAGERVLALVEPVDVHALAGEFPLGLLRGHIAAHGHEVAGVLGEEVEPVFEAPLVEELGFPVEKLLDLLLEQQPGERKGLGAHRGPRSFQLPASMNWRQRV